MIIKQRQHKEMDRDRWGSKQKFTKVQSVWVVDIFQDMMAEAKLLRQHKGRLEARMQILEDHNRQLEAQLQRLRQLLDEVRNAKSIDGENFSHKRTFSFPP